MWSLHLILPGSLWLGQVSAHTVFYTLLTVSDLTSSERNRNVIQQFLNNMQTFPEPAINETVQLTAGRTKWKNQVLHVQINTLLFCKTAPKPQALIFLLFLFPLYREKAVDKWAQHTFIFQHHLLQITMALREEEYQGSTETIQQWLMYVFNTSS